MVPNAEAKVPAAQGEQDAAAAAAAKYPGEHALHFTPSESVPAGQAAHALADAAPKELELVPTRHGVHASPALLKDPGEHGAQTVALGDDDEPAAHAEHADALETLLKLPTAHGEHVGEPRTGA